MHKIIDPTQSIFIQERYILDNILVVNEIIYYAKVHKQKGLILKINFEKTYDRVNWSFVKLLLLSRDFGTLDTMD
jgi:hypothetical protein